MATGSDVILLNRSKAIVWYALALIVVILDQWSKYAATASLDYAVPVPVLSVLDITLHHNTGAAFSFLSDAGGWQRHFFSAIAVLASLGMAVWLWCMARSQTLLAVSIALILGGAIGNVIDRIVLGYVVDFISVHWQQWYFPTFNIADSAITLGAVGMVIDSLWGQDEQQTENGK